MATALVNGRVLLDDGFVTGQAVLIEGDRIAAMDPFVGKLGLFRVHQGTIRAGAQLFVGDGRKPVKIAHLFRMGRHPDSCDQPCSWRDGPLRARSRPV